MFRNAVAAIVAPALSAAAVGSLVLIIAAAGTAAASPSAMSSGGRPTTIKLHKTSRGMILVNNQGFTLYAFGKDRRNHDSCVSIRNCTGRWPIVTTSGKPRAAGGVNRSMLGTIRVKGKTQVTYGGHPLYRYALDGGPGQTSYVGVSQFHGVWRAVKASGQTVG
jgi:predicted lipoprotein with Yx(FWY)xxD motif